MDYSKYRMFKEWLKKCDEIDKAKSSEHLTPLAGLLAIIAIVLNLIFG